MKIIDHTPYFDNETGKINFLDRARAMMKYGSAWIKEVEAQKEIITVLSKVLDRSYTLLSNVTPPGLEASFPLILVGPTGVFVIYVTPLTGIFRAKGDQWGSISGNAFKVEKPNLLTRTERMARAIQVFLQRQGYLDITSVEAILLCSDLSVNVDSIRPIIRVVMRDALERFAISISQARVTLSPEAVQDIIGRILNPPKPPPPEEDLATAIPDETDFPKVAEIDVPVSAFPELQNPELEIEPDPLGTVETQDHSQDLAWINDLTSSPSAAPQGSSQVPAWSNDLIPPSSAEPQDSSQAPAWSNDLTYPPSAGSQDHPQAPAWSNDLPYPPIAEPHEPSQTPAWSDDLIPPPSEETQDLPGTSRGIRLNKNQRALIIVLFVIWLIIISVFIFIVIKDQWSLLSGQLP